MDRAEAPAPHPAFLPPGTLVGPWRVVAAAGRGAYGAVYKAERVGEEHSGPVALKLALNPSDPRFAREAELLRRLHHPNIPHLYDCGDWQSPSGALHPFLAMEWIDGLPLYDWVQKHEPSSKRVLRILAQLARALEALHALGAVHRDVKGDNVLVRLSKLQVAINGGCWVPIEREACEALNGQMFKARCYVPAMPSGRPPPFSPAQSP